MSDSSSSEKPTPKVRRTPKKRMQKFIQNKRAKFDVESDSDAEIGKSTRSPRLRKDGPTNDAENDVATKEGASMDEQNVADADATAKEADATSDTDDDVGEIAENVAKKRTIDDGSDSDDKKRRRRRSFKKRLKVDKAELERLERLVLGDGETLLKNMTILEKDSGVDDDVANDSEYSDTLASPKRSPAWADADDRNFTKASDVVKKQRPLGLKATSNYQDFLRKKFKDVYGEPSWAKLGKKTDDDDSLLLTSGKLIEKSKRLGKGTIDVKRLAFLNSSTRNEGPFISSVRFHPTANVALIAGAKGQVNVVTVDGAGNSKLAAVRFEKFPIRCARFGRSGDEFIVGSNAHAHFYVYDLLKGTPIKIPLHKNCEQTNLKKFEISPDGQFIAAAGRFGQIHLLTANSKEWIASLTMNGSCDTLCFSSDGKLLYTYGNQGEIYVWDIASRRLKHKFTDEGSIKGVSLTVSPNDDFIAAGSTSGVVNLYDAATALSRKNPTPLKAFMNLVTSATSLAFDSSSQILAMASSYKDNAIKLAHVQSATVFANFPTFSTQLNSIQDLAISPSSGYLALANNKGTVPLFRIKHFGNY